MTPAKWGAAALLIGACTLAFEQKPAATAKPATSFSGAVFEVPIQPHYQGNDLRKIADAVDHMATAEKGEYETTAAFNARLEGMKAAPLFGNISINSPMAFVFPTAHSRQSLRADPTLQSSYDADEGLMTVSLSADEGNISEPLEATDLATLVVWDMVSMSAGYYHATNAFGVAATVRDSKGTSYGLALPLSSKSRLESGVSFKVSPDRARILERRVRILLVCKVHEPRPLVAKRWQHAPTLDEPYKSDSLELYLRAVPVKMVIFDDETGEVLGQKEIL